MRLLVVFVLSVLATLAERGLDVGVACVNNDGVDLGDHVAYLTATDGDALSLSLSRGLEAGATGDHDLLEVRSRDVLAHRAADHVGAAGDLHGRAVEADGAPVYFLADFLAEETVGVLSIYLLLVRSAGVGVGDDDSKFCHAWRNWAGTQKRIDFDLLRCVCASRLGRDALTRQKLDQKHSVTPSSLPHFARSVFEGSLARSRAVLRASGVCASCRVEKQVGHIGAEVGGLGGFLAGTETPVSLQHAHSTMRVSVIGGGTVSEEEYAVAEEVGRLLGERGHTVVCGGLGGVMEAACKGASEVGGETIGILPGEDISAANPYVETAITTGLGHARNALVVMNGEGMIAIDGGPGTLSEIGFAGIFDRPVAGLLTHSVPGVTIVETPVDAVEFVEQEV